jgi:hypothetical protein
MSTFGHCPKVCQKPKLLEAHIEAAHQHRRWPCPLCPQRARHLCHLKQHVRRTHRREDIDYDQIEPVRLDGESAGDHERRKEIRRFLRDHPEPRYFRQKFHCPEKKCCYSNKEKHHITKVSAYTVKFRNLTLSFFRKHYNGVHRKIRWPCPHCMSLLSAEGELRAHVRTQHRDQRYTSDQALPIEPDCQEARERLEWMSKNRRQVMGNS